MRLVLVAIVMILISILITCYKDNKESFVINENDLYDYQDPKLRYYPPHLSQCNTNVIKQEFEQYNSNHENKFKNPVENADAKTEKDIKPWDFQPTVKYNFTKFYNPYETLTVQKEKNPAYWVMYDVYPRTAFEIGEEEYLEKTEPVKTCCNC
jgi:hypothetical protein